MFFSIHCSISWHLFVIKGRLVRVIEIRGRSLATRCRGGWRARWVGKLSVDGTENDSRLILPQRWLADFICSHFFHLSPPWLMMTPETGTGEGRGDKWTSREIGVKRPADLWRRHSQALDTTALRSPKLTTAVLHIPFSLTSTFIKTFPSFFPFLVSFLRAFLFLSFFCKSISKCHCQVGVPNVFVNEWEINRVELMDGFKCWTLMGSA